MSNPFELDTLDLLPSGNVFDLKIYRLYIHYIVCVEQWQEGARKKEAKNVFWTKIKFIIQVINRSTL